MCLYHLPRGILTMPHAPENIPSKKKGNLPTINFSGAMLNFGRVILFHLQFRMLRFVQTNDFLVGGFNPFEKYGSKWESSPNMGENKKCWKPPPSFPFSGRGWRYYSQSVDDLFKNRLQQTNPNFPAKPRNLKKMMPWQIPTKTWECKCKTQEKSFRLPSCYIQVGNC